MTQTYTITNPYNGDVLGEYNYQTLESCIETIATLKKGRRTQRALPAFERANILRKLADLLEDNSERLAQLITAETGKTISDSRVELVRAINTTVASGEEARQISGDALDSDAYAPARGRLGVVCWKPLGTILCITPFNFPINIAMHKIGPAFAAGNTILFKPGPQNIASSTLLTELCYEAGIPRDVIQLCMPEVSDMSALIAHDDIGAVNFTGGTGAAKSIAAAAGYKRLLLELGGNDPLIVMPDGDIQAAVSAAINQRFATAGQRCTAAKRLFIHNDVYDEFKTALVQASAKLKVGNPTDEDTFVGPVINAQAADSIKSLIDGAVSIGGKLLLGGTREGNIIHPTILEDLPSDCDFLKQEIFGPVMPLCRFSELEEVIEAVNDTPFGLQAGVFTDNLKVIRTLFEELEVGTVASNDGPGFRAEHFPFGGVKQSGIGREGVKYAIREMSFQKTLVI